MLMQHKIKSVDFLAIQRGRCAISLWQNYGFKIEPIRVKGDTKEFMGLRYSGRNFNYTVEAGSTTPKTSLQVEAQSKDFYNMGAIDRQALLENSNYPGWKEVIERVGEGMLAQALQVLVQSGLDQDLADGLYEKLMASQGGPGNRGGNGTGDSKGGSKAVSPPRASGGQSKPPVGIHTGANLPSRA